MKKLNVTKERFEKSRYFQRKYGNLEYVSESGNMYKTNKGMVLMFKEYTDGYEGIYGHLADGTWDAAGQSAQAKQIESGVMIYRTNKLGDLWTIKTMDGGLRLKEDIQGFKRAMKIAQKNGWKVVKTVPKNPEMANESHKADKAHTCPRCGFTGCTVDDLDILKGDCKEGGTFDASFYCDQCGGTYNVTFGLSIQDIYDTSNDENLDVDLPDSELEDDDF